MNENNSISLYTCSSNQAYKSNTIKNDAILITGHLDQQIHISTKITNSNNESLIVLNNDYMTINGICDVKGTLLIDNIDLLEYVESNINKQESVIYVDNSVRIGLDDNNFPGYSWSNDLNTGMYQSNIENIDFAVNTYRKMNINDNGVSIYGNCQVYGDIIKKTNNINKELLTKSIYIGNDIQENIPYDHVYLGQCYIGIIDFDTTSYKNNTFFTESINVDPVNNETTFTSTSYIYSQQIRGILPTQYGGTGTTTKTGTGIPVHNINPVFNNNIIVNENVIANEYKVKIPDTIRNSTFIDNSLELLDKLNPILYNSNNTLKCLIHNDVNLIPEMSHIISNDNGETLYNYLQLIPYLVQAIKELKSRLDLL